jgi:hypothetical protein
MATTAYVLDVRDGWTRSISGTVPWFLYAVLFASTSVIVGVTWDISWHRSIGRDTFWTPAHLAIYLGGIVAGLTCGWLALRLSFAHGAAADAERAATVRFWGFRAPLGAWVCIWGAFAMLTSAPFDDWWHNSYGLDVKILSPPHALLAAGIGAIQYGAMLMAVAWQNRSPVQADAGTDAMRSRLGFIYLVSAGLLLVLIATLATEYLQRWDMHRSLFYQVAAGIFPLMLVSTARASVSRWPATTTALVYMALMFVMLLVLPLFRAEPLLGPIYVHLDRFMPPDFPLLLAVPALLIDLAMRRLGRGRDWRLSALVALAFVVAFLAAQWPFADFMMTSWARNPIFIADRMPYSVDPAFQARWYTLNRPDNLRVGLSIALALAFVSARCGLWWGNWMSRVRR